MAEATKTDGLTRALQVALLGAVLLVGMYAARTVLQPLVFGVLLALVLTPVCRFFEHRGLRRIPAVALTVASMVGVFGVAGAAIVYQFALLADNLQRYQAMLSAKVGALGGGEQVWSRAASAVAAAVETVNRMLRGDDRAAAEVRIVDEPIEQLQLALAPWISGIGVAAIVGIFVAFLLVRRDDLSDRILRLLGQHRTGVTSRALDEAGRRISRYLSALSAVNLCYGTAIATGLWLIGIPLAVLWGALAGVLRFIPYVGTMAGIAGPMLMAVVLFPGWQEPLLVAALFATVVAVLVGLAEPLIYGRTTGVSRVGLLVSALFWSWLWGPVGLALATPMTVALAVAGKYVPGLGGLAMLLSEKVDIDDHLRLYHRLLAGDRVGARAMVDAAAASDVDAALDRLLLPVVVKTAGDARDGALTVEQRTAIERLVDDLVDEIEWRVGATVATVTPGRPDAIRSVSGDGIVIGVAAHPVHDALLLRMVNLVLHPWGRQLRLVDAPSDELLSAALAELQPATVVISAVAADATRAAIEARVRAAAPRAAVHAGPGNAPAGSATALVPLRDRILAQVLDDAEIVRRLTDAWLRDDEARAAATLDVAARLRSVDALCLRVIDPTWRALLAQPADDPRAADKAARAGRHFHAVLRDTVSAVREPAPGAPRALLASPGAAEPSLPIVLLSVVMRARGWDVLYLGNTVDVAGLATVLRSAAPTVAVYAIDAAQLPALRAAIAGAATGTRSHFLPAAGDALDVADDERLDVDLARAVDRIGPAPMPAGIAPAALTATPESQA